MPKDIHNAQLLERVDVHEDLAFFRVGYIGHEVPAFEPGQFATLGLPDNAPPDPNAPHRPDRGPRLIRRAYSIASPATQRDALEFYIVKVDAGKLTTTLWDVPVGSTLFMNEKIGGHFTLDGIPPGKNLIMIGTGTGLAPFRSMYLTYKNDSRWNKLIMFDGVRNARDLGYYAELKKLSEEDERLIYLPTVTRDPVDSSWPGLRGRVNQWLEPHTFKTMTGVDLDPAECHVLLCGNPQMIDQVEVDLTARGFVTRDRKNPDGNIHFERYW